MPDPVGRARDTIPQLYTKFRTHGLQHGLLTTGSRINIIRSRWSIPQVTKTRPKRPCRKSSELINQNIHSFHPSWTLRPVDLHLSMKLVRQSQQEAYPPASETFSLSKFKFVGHHPHGSLATARAQITLQSRSLMINLFRTAFPLPTALLYHPRTLCFLTNGRCL